MIRSLGSAPSFAKILRSPMAHAVPFVHHRRHFLSRDLLGVLLQWRSAFTTPHRFAGAVLAKPLHPPDCRTDADVEQFSRFTAGTSCFNKADDPPSQFTRIRSTHWLVPRNQCVILDSPISCVSGIPIHSGRGHAVAERRARHFQL